MFYQTRGDLFRADPGHATEDGVVGECSAERLFIAHSILDDDEGRLIVRNALKKGGYGRWIDGFVCADYVVKVCVGVCWGLEDCGNVSRGGDASV